MAVRTLEERCTLSLYERADIIAGRSMTRSKAPGRMFDVGAGPTHVIDASGARILGDDHRWYIDMLCGLGAISLGYQSRNVNVAGGVYSLPHQGEVVAAEHVLEYVAPWASQVRFLKTGSEATHAAYRIAKADTGRSRVLVGDWAYHGWHEWSANAEAFRNGWHFFDGTDPSHWSGVAAIFIEPHRWEPVDVDWLQRVREMCSRRGILLVFDSMIYGGRWALGGTSAFFGVEPDLEVFGKAFGNGHAVAFIVGKEELAQHGEMVSGTYSGDVTGLSAVYETLHTYTHEPVIETLWKRGRQLQRGLKSVIPEALGVCEGAPVHQRIRFVDPAHGKRFAAGMVSRGILWHPDVTNIMYAHTAEQIEQVVEAAGESAKDLA